MFAFKSLCLVALAAAGVLSAPSNRKRQAPSGVPSYVTTYVWLYSGDKYRPSDIGAQLENTTPENNFKPVSGVPNPLTLNNLGELNALNGSNIYLTSKENILTNPPWLFGVTPNSSGKTNGATSCAIIVNDKGNGTVDAFYMYFYAFNYGDVVLGELFGDHVGDWEHNMVRFYNGTPQALWYSQHGFGQAFTYSAVTKQGVRPISYSANGTHANYVAAGTHDHTIPGIDLPFGPIEDYTNQGVLWDPTLSAYYYSVHFTPESDPNAQPVFTAYDNASPTSWLNFVGMWGDEQYPSSDPNQFEIFGQARYVGGPTGPEDKQLNRWHVCPTGEDCVVQEIILPGERRAALLEKYAAKGGVAAYRRN